MNTDNYKVYYKDTGSGRYLVCDSKTMKCTFADYIPYKFHHFQMFGKYYKLCQKYNIQDGDDFLLKAINPELKEYTKNIRIWQTQLYDANCRRSNFDYMLAGKKRNHNFNIMRFLHSTFSQEVKETIANFAPITFQESKYIESTYNAGMAKFHGITNHEYDVFTCDFKMSYPTLMASRMKLFRKQKEFYFPICEGREVKTVPGLNKRFECGIYHIKIESTHDDFNEYFVYNATNYYTNIELNYLYDNKDELEITFTDLHDHLIYDEIINGSDIFGQWFHRCRELKTELKGNQLVKMLTSSCWGYLSEKNTKTYTEEQLDENDDIVTTFSKNHILPKHTHYIEKETYKQSIANTIFKLQSIEQPYKTAFRLKPWITAMQRIQMYEIIDYIGFEHVLRYHTDSISFNNETLTSTMKTKLQSGFVSDRFIYEDKTSGNLTYYKGRWNKNL